MRREKTLVLGIDPGSVHVGFSMARGHESPVFGEMEPDAFISQFSETTVRRVAMERFDIRQFTNDSLKTIKFIGVIEYFCRDMAINIGWVNASDKKKFIDMIHPSITDHARDAEAIRLWDLAYGKW